MSSLSRRRRTRVKTYPDECPTDCRRFEPATFLIAHHDLRLTALGLSGEFNSRGRSGQALEADKDLRGNARFCQRRLTDVEA